ncbi:MAG: DUF1540 domain-containing protein [Turicibacter sp.]|nr:DUF1540 domain-containing protein [Turicibacter sp.]
MSVNCSATKCVHNDKDGNCYAKLIHVRGELPASVDGIMCHSYAPEGPLEVEFALEFDAPCHQATTSNIQCGARKCKHFENSKCKAGDVQISKLAATCETFQGRT